MPPPASDRAAPRRRDDIIAVPLPDGLFLFDPVLVRAHALNASAAAVWARCTGDRTAGEIADDVAASLGGAAPASLRADVLAVVEQLDVEHLVPREPRAELPVPEPPNRFTNVPHSDVPFVGSVALASDAPVHAGLAFRFRVAADDDALLAFVLDVLDPLRVRGDADDTDGIDDLVGADAAPLPGPGGHDGVSRYEVTQADDGYVIALDGFVVAAHLSAADVAATLLWHVNQMVSTTDARHVLLHASAATAHGRAAVFPAAMNSGKSTLVTALARAGLGYVTDETAAVDPATLRVAPYPKAIGLDPGSWPLFPDLEPPAAIVRGPFAHRKWYVDPRRHGFAIAAPTALGVVAFTTYQAGVAATARPLPVAEAAVRLAQNSFNLVAMGRIGVEAIVRIATTVPCVELSVDALPEAVALVRRLLAAPDALDAPAPPVP